MKRKRSSPAEGIKLRGFARLQLWERDEHGIPQMKGDSGWIHNVITQNGSQNYIINQIASLAGSKTPSHFALGNTQAANVATNDTSLTNEYTTFPARAAINKSLGADKTLVMTASFASAAQTGARTIGAIAVYNASSGATMGSGATFNSSKDLVIAHWLLSQVRRTTGATL